LVTASSEDEDERKPACVTQTPVSPSSEKRPASYSEAVSSSLAEPLVPPLDVDPFSACYAWYPEKALKQHLDIAFHRYPHRTFQLGGRALPVSDLYIYVLTETPKKILTYLREVADNPRGGADMLLSLYELFYCFRLPPPIESRYERGTAVRFVLSKFMLRYYRYLYELNPSVHTQALAQALYNCSESYPFDFYHYVIKCTGPSAYKLKYCSWDRLYHEFTMVVHDVGEPDAKGTQTPYTGHCLPTSEDERDEACLDRPCMLDEWDAQLRLANEQCVVMGPDGEKLLHPPCSSMKLSDARVKAVDIVSNFEKDFALHYNEPMSPAGMYEQLVFRAANRQCHLLTILKCVGALSGVLAAVGIGYAIVGWRNERNKIVHQTEFFPEALYSHNKMIRINHGGSAHKNARATKMSRGMGMSGEIDNRGPVSEIITSHALSFKRVGGSLHGLQIMGNVAMLNAHFFLDQGDWLPEDFEFVVTIKGKDHAQKFKLDNLRVEGDVAYYLLKNVVYVKSILNYFVDREYAAFNYRGPAKLHHPDHVLEVNVTQADHAVDYQLQGRAFVVKQALLYEGVTQPGDCGVPIVVANRIVGIHAFKSVRVGGHAGGIYLSNSIISEHIKAFEGVYTPQGDCAFKYAEDSIVRDFASPQADFAKPECPSTGRDVHYGGGANHKKSVSKIIPSLIFNTEVCREARESYQPAILGAHDPRADGATVQSMCYRSPLAAASACITYDMSVMEKVCAQRTDFLITTISPVCGVGLLTDHQIWNGDPGIPHLNPMDMSRSAGFPWNKESPGPKSRFFTRNEDGFHVCTSNDLKISLAEVNAAVEEGLVPDFIFDISLKDEVLPNSKIVDKKTRSFWIAPIEALYLNKKYFGHFVAAYMSGCGRTGSAVGINPYSPAWDAMFKKLIACSPVGFDGDYKAYETILVDGVAELLARLINAWYQRYQVGGDVDKDNFIRLNLIRSALHSDFRIAPFFFRKSGMMPSGWFLTTIFNTEFGLWLLQYSFRILAQEQRIPENDHVALFKAKVAIADFGDDNITASALPWFNQAAHARIMATCGVIFTPSQKDATPAVVNVPMECLGFLGNDTVRATYPFAPDLEFWAVGGTRSLYKPITFVRQSHDDLLMLIMNVHGAQRRIFGAGPARFNEFTTAVRDACNEVSITPTLLSYDEIRDDFINGVYQDDYDDCEFADRDYERARGTFYGAQRSKCEYEPQMDVVEFKTSDKLGVQTKSAIPDDVYQPVASVLTLCKRPYLIQNIVGNRTLVSFLKPSAKTTGYLQWLSPLYRVYRGGLIFAHRDGTPLTTTCLQENIGDITFSGAFANETLDTAISGSGYAPKNMTTGTLLSTQVMFPWVSEYDFNIVPQIGVVETRFHNSGYISCANNDPGYTTCRVAHGFGFWNLYRVPRIKVLGSHFQHELDNPISLPTSLRMEQGIGFPDPRISTQDFIAWNNTIAFETGAAFPSAGANVFYHVAAMTIQTSALSDGQLRALGFPITDGQPRVYQPGSATVTAELGAYVRVPSTPVCFYGGQVGPSLHSSKCTPGSESFLYVNSSGFETLIAAVWSFDVSSWLSPAFKSFIIDYPTAFVAAIDYTLNIPLQTNASNPISAGGYVFRIFSDEAFAYLVDPADEEFVAQMDTGVHIVVEEEKVVDETAQTRSGTDENQMTYVQAVARPQVVTRFQWTTTDAVGTVLLQLNLPWDILVSETNAAPFRRFLYSSWESIEVTATITTNPFQCGVLFMYAVPLTDPSEVASTHSNSLTSQSILRERVAIPAGRPGAYTITIPWLYPKHMLDAGLIDIEPVFSILQIGVFSELRTGVDATVLSADIVVSARVIGGKFSVPTIAPPPTDFVTSARERMRARRGVFHAVSDLNHYQPQGLFDFLGPAVKGLASKAVDFGASQLGTFVKGLILDFPNNGMIVDHSSVTFDQRNANIEGLSNAEVLDERFGETYVGQNLPDPTLDLQFTSIVARPCYLGRFSVSVATEIESIVWSTELSPTAYLSAAQPGQIVQPTLQAYISLMATFWRADMEYHFVPVMCNAHSVKIAFASNYARFTPPAQVDESFAQFATFHDFTADNGQFTLTVPWRAATNMLRVSKGFNSDRSNYAYGSIYARAMTPLQAPETVSNNAEILIFVSMRNASFRNFNTGSVDFVVV
jgi:hypothetical protein